MTLFCFTETKFLLRKEMPHFQKEGKTILTVTFPENVFIPSGKTNNFQVKHLLHGNICLPSYWWLLHIRIVLAALSFKRFPILGNKLSL